LTGIKAAEGVAMMFGIHGGEEVGGGFVVWFGLLGAPVHTEAVAKSAEQPHDPHGIRLSDSAQVVQVRDIQALVQSAFNAPGCAICL
jgi:hypothetical protein